MFTRCAYGTKPTQAINICNLPERHFYIIIISKNNLDLKLFTQTLSLVTFIGCAHRKAKLLYKFSYAIQTFNIEGRYFERDVLGWKFFHIAGTGKEGFT